MERLAVTIGSADDGSVVIRLDGELDLSSTTSLDPAVAGVFSDPGRRIVLDLSSLRFLDSSGLGAIARLMRRGRSAGCDLRVVPGPPQVMRVFELTGMDYVIGLSTEIGRASASREAQDAPPEFVS